MYVLLYFLFYYKFNYKFNYYLLNHFDDYSGASNNKRLTKCLIIVKVSISFMKNNLEKFVELSQHKN